MQYNPTEDEKQVATKVSHYLTLAQAIRTNITSDVQESIEDIWDDEYKLYKGGGLQWKTTIAYRTEKGRKVRPNSEDNFVFNAVQNIVSNITASTPEVNVSGIEPTDNKIADKITFMSKFNDQRNNFRRMWKRQVQNYIAYGPIIGMVVWDPDWLGGAGPDRWVGEVRLIDVDRRDFYPDPAIIDLEQNLQDCEFIIRRIRAKVDTVKKMNEKIADSISPENNDIMMQDEGGDPQQTYVYECWHKGTPWMMTKEMQSKILDEAEMHEANGDSYRARDYRDMAKGDMDGIHVAYIANNVLVKYIPYVYDDGKYPFVFKTRYHDENTQWGFGEIRNIKIPQILHNKADEIEIEAMSRQGLGGMYYNTGAVNNKQLDTIKQNSGKGAVWLEVDNVNLLRDREGVQVPGSLITYKEHKQRMIETVSNVTPIQQGMSPGANMPYKAIAELGARTDVRLKAATEILEDYLIELNKLRISRFAQFYTEDRYFRIKSPKGEVIDGTLKNTEMMLVWSRETETDPTTGMQVEKKEYFIPEFDVNVRIIDEKPTDRNYYTNTALTLFQMGLMLPADVWYTLEEGKWPPKDDILEKLQAKDQIAGLLGQLSDLPPEVQQEYMQTMQETLQNIKQIMPQMQNAFAKQNTIQNMGGMPNGQANK